MRGFRVESVKNFKPFNELSFYTRKALIETTPDTYAEVYPGVELNKVFGDLVVHFRIDNDYGFESLSLAYLNFQNTHAFLESVKPAFKQPLQPDFPLDPARPYWARPVNQPIERKEEPMKYIVDAKEIKKHQSYAKQNIKQICEDLASNPFVLDDKVSQVPEILDTLENAVNSLKKNIKYLQYVGNLLGASSIEMDETEYARFNEDLSD
jgi:hypothetical protein